MKKPLIYLTALCALLLFICSCEEDEGTDPNENVTSVEDLKPIVNNGQLDANIGGSSFSTNLIVAGVGSSKDYPNIDSFIIGGFKVGNNDTTYISVSLVGDFEQIQINKKYTGFTANTQMLGLYYNTSQNLLGGGEASITFIELDRENKVVSGSFNFTADALNRDTFVSTTVPVIAQFRGVEYVIISEE